MIGAVLQCRMSSSRFPGKVALDLPWGSGRPILKRISDQLKKSRHVQKFIVATSTDPTDDAVEALCKQHGLICYRGSLNDVYQRYVDAASEHGLDQVVRLTGDNPLVDVHHLDLLIDQHLAKYNDYTQSKGLPLGCNFEIVRLSSLKSLAQKKMTSDHHEHVTLYFRHHPKEHQAETIQFQFSDGKHDPRMTIDYPSDYAFWNLVSQIEPNLESLAQLDRILTQYPWLILINQDNLQKIY